VGQSADHIVGPVVVVALIAFLIFSLAGLVTDLPIYEQGLDDTKAQIQAQFESMGMGGESVAEALTSVSRRVLGIGASIAVNLVGYLVSVFFIILMFAFMLFDAGGFRSRMQRASTATQPGPKRW
jgi:predicted PurR-regulated permease PerM